MSQKIVNQLGKRVYKLVVLCSLIFFPIFVTAQEDNTVILVTGFKVDSPSEGKYQFVPNCGESPCETWQLDMHLFEWHFPNQTVSLLPQPLLSFTQSFTANEIVLKVSGIKQMDDPDSAGMLVATECLPYKGCEYSTETFNLPSSDTILEMLTSEFPTKCGIGPITRRAIPAGDFIFPLNISSHENCDNTVKVKVWASFNARRMTLPISIWNGEEWELLDPYPRSFSLLDGNSQNCLLKVRIPSEGLPLDSSIQLISSFEHSDNAGNGCQYLNEVDTVQIKIHGSIDPNKKTTSSPCWIRQNSTVPILYQITFENIGYEAETDIEIIDTLDERLNSKLFKMDKVKLNNRTIPFSRSKGNRPNPGPGIHQADTLKQPKIRVSHNPNLPDWDNCSYSLKGNILKIYIHAAKNNPLRKDQTGTITYSLPVRTDVMLTDTINRRCDEKSKLCVPIPNTAWIHFSKETTISGVPAWHKAELVDRPCIIPSSNRN